MVNLPIKQSKTALPSTTVTLHGIEVHVFDMGWAQLGDVA